MGVYEGRGQLTKGMKELMRWWMETRSQWDDKQAHDFESRFIQPLEQDMRNTLSAMDHMTAILQQVRRDCE